MNLDMVYEDLTAFADDNNDVEIDRSGTVMMVRGGNELSFVLKENTDGHMFVQENGIMTPYRTFLSHRIAGLHVLAERLSVKRQPVNSYVDGMAKRESLSLGDTRERSLVLINEECTEASPFAARVVFITADAGQGKTALLREYQTKQATSFLKGKSQFIFWHVDLQGRQLLRLSEALMGDLGDLRVSGIWMAGVVVLLRHRLLVLGIDGFDELAAEQGRTDALGALSLLVQQMRDQGVIVAASRRTFFDTEDYAKRSGMLRRRISGDCEFDQIHLLDWSKEEDVAYLREVSLKERKMQDPENTYKKILRELNDQHDHPMLAKPFLFSHLVRGLLLYGTSPSDFMKGMQVGLEGVANVVKAFIRREVAEKWKTRDTGEPYLTEEQHMELLATAAQEMWSVQRDRLPLEILETLAVLLFDEWKIPEERRRQVLDMVKMHVLLTIPHDGDDRSRSFDHPEFRDYFVAYTLSRVLKKSIEGVGLSELAGFLSIAQLPDAVARYAASMMERNEQIIKKICKSLEATLSKEWRPTFLQTNIGTVLPYMLNGYTGSEVIHFKGHAVFSSLVLEGTTLSNIEIEDAMLLNMSFVGVQWDHIGFLNCEFSEMTVDKKSLYRNVILRDCKVHGVKVNEDGDEVVRAYSPERIKEALELVGITIVSSGGTTEPCVLPENETRKLAYRFLRMFRKTTVVSERILKIKLPPDKMRDLLDNIIPVALHRGIIEKKSWHGGGPQTDLWSLYRGLEDILKADCGEGEANLVDFWRDIDKIEEKRKN